jgi:glycosyltransferase involved in cell wall biosynthesis
LVKGELKVEINESVKDLQRIRSTKRVLIITPNLSETAGGVERFSWDVFRSLTASGYQGEVWAPDAGSGLRAKLITKLGFGQIALSLKAGRYAKEQKFDAVISGGSVGCIFSGRSVRRIHVYHGTVFFHNWADRRAHRVRYWLLRKAFLGGLSELIVGIGACRVAVSSSTRRELKIAYNLSVSKVIENGVAVSLSPQQPREGVVFVGRRETRKGYEEAVEACLQLGIKLQVAGPGIDTRTNNLGILARADVEVLFRRAQFFLFPTRYEACSYAILEAMVAGCPVVTTEVGWMSELVAAVPEYKHLILRSSDCHEIVKVLDWASRNPEVVLEIQKKATLTVLDRNNLESFRIQWTSLMDSCLKVERGGS